MKNLFANFQLSKNEMNEIKGGQTQVCHCGGSNDTFEVAGTTYEELEKNAGGKCKQDGWACTPQ